MALGGDPPGDVLFSATLSIENPPGGGEGCLLPSFTHEFMYALIADLNRKLPGMIGTTYGLTANTRLLHKL